MQTLHSPWRLSHLYAIGVCAAMAQKLTDYTPPPLPPSAYTPSVFCFLYFCQHSACKIMTFSLIYR